MWEEGYKIDIRWELPIPLNTDETSSKRGQEINGIFKSYKYEVTTRTKIQIFHISKEILALGTQRKSFKYWNQISHNTHNNLI